MAKAPLPPDEIIKRIKKALARDKSHTWEDLDARLKVGTAQIFWNEHGAWVTEVVQAPRKRTLNVWVVAGELPEVMDLQDEVIAFARKMECEEIYATARFGWKHVARAHGWHEKAVLITHEV